MYKPPHLRTANNQTRPPATLVSASGGSGGGFAGKDVRVQGHGAGGKGGRSDGQNGSKPDRPAQITNKTKISNKSNYADMEMEFLASVSRSGGYGDSGDALKDHSVQERYMTYINGIRDPKARIPLFRKLREGIVASHRLDTFALTSFGASVHCAIEAKNAPQLYAALNGLMALYEAGIKDSSRAHFTTLLLLYHLVHSPRASYQSALQSLPVGTDVALAKKAARVLAPETFDPRTYFILIEQIPDQHERTLLSWASPSVRDRATALLRKAYISTSVTWASALLGSEEAVRSGLTVDNGVVKLR